MDSFDGVGDFLHTKYGVENGSQGAEILSLVKEQHARGKRLLDTHQRLPEEMAEAKMVWQRAELIRAARTLMDAQRLLEDKIHSIEEKKSKGAKGIGGEWGYCGHQTPAPSFPSSPSPGCTSANTTSIATNHCQ